MSGYRLHIDVPFECNEEESARISKMVIGILEKNFDSLKHIGISKLNYRLGHDEDRQKSNYLDKNENGHCSNKKIKIVL